MADTQTLARSRAEVTRNVSPDQIASLEREAAHNYTNIATEVVRSPHFHLWQIIKQNAAAQDPAAKYLKSMGAVRMRDVLSVEDYFTAVASQDQRNDNGRGGNAGSGGGTGRNAPDREFTGNRS